MYLARLAAWCHVPPAAVDDLTVPDFVILTAFCDRKNAARRDGGDL